MRIVFIEITLYHYTIFVFTWLVLSQLQNSIKKKIFYKIFWYAVCKFMSTTIKIKLTGYIYNINGNKIWKIKDKSQDSITSLVITFDPLKPVGNKSSHILTLGNHAQSSATTRHMAQRYIKPIFGRYRLHSLHGQFFVDQFLVPDLKALKLFTSFNSAGTISQILGPKNDRLHASVLTYTYIHF